MSKLEDFSKNYPQLYADNEDYVGNNPDVVDYLGQRL